MNTSTSVFAGVSSLALLLALGVSAPAVAANSGCTPDQPNPGDCAGVYKKTGEGDASGENVTINDTVTGGVFGGVATDGTVTNNRVTLNGTSRVGGDVYGGQGAYGNVNGNSVTLNDNSTVGISVYGGASGFGTVSGNSVTLNGNSSVDSYVYGGWSVSGTVSGNSVTLNGSSRVGGDVFGGWSDSGAATNNRVILNGGTVHGDIRGAWTHSGNVSGNSVTLNGGTVHGDIYGGLNLTGSSDVTGNSVTINGGNFGTNTVLYGGVCDAFTPSCPTSTKDFRTGNSLILSTTATVKGAQNFQHFNFALNRGLVGQTLLTTTDAVVLTPVGTNNATVNLGVGGREPLAMGHRFTLIQQTDGSDFNINGQTFNAATNNSLKNVFHQYGLRQRTYDFGLDHTGGTLGANVTRVSADSVMPQAASLGDATVASLGMMNTAADFAAGDGMREARSIAGLDSGLNAGDGDTMRGGAFAAVTGGQLRYRANGHTTVDGMSLLGGFSVGIPLSTGQAMAGVFVESGWGSYKGRSKQDISSNGNTRYVGGGLLGRYELDGFYVEGSGRIGRTENHYNSTLTDGAGNTANYKRTNTYYGLHGGLGYVLPVTNAINVDLSTKYFWTHQSGNNVSVLNDPVKIDAANSHRWRTGARVNAAVATGVVPYVGAYYEHEFDAKAKMTTVGLNIPGPSMKGGTGVAELGVTFGAPTDIYKVDVGVTGYAGKYSGATGSVKAKWAF